MPTSIGSSERVWKVFAWIQCKKRNRLEQERASQLAHVHWSLRYHSRQADPCYEEVILPDVSFIELGQSGLLLLFCFKKLSNFMDFFSANL